METPSEEHKKIPPMLSIYLGDSALAAKRIANLDRLAEKLGVNRSKLIQMLADGKLTLTVTLD